MYSPLFTKMKIPGDTVPDDTVPDDTVPDNTVPDDTIDVMLTMKRNIGQNSEIKYIIHSVRYDIIYDPNGKGSISIDSVITQLEFRGFPLLGARISFKSNTLNNYISLGLEYIYRDYPIDFSDISKDRFLEIFAEINPTFEEIGRAHV